MQQGKSKALIGFTGSRSLSPAWAGLVGQVVSAVQASGQGVAVGCALGADYLVRTAAPNARVFSVVNYPTLPPAVALVRRSVAMVKAVAASGARLVGFVSSPCPPQVQPSPSPSRCFNGSGSGSWASLALAVGLGLQVVVFWCGQGEPVLPAWAGRWVPAGAGVWASGWRFVPAQLAMF